MKYICKVKVNTISFCKKIEKNYIIKKLNKLYLGLELVLYDLSYKGA